MTIWLASCATSGKPQLARSLPPRPDFAKPEAVPDPKAGEDAVTVAARERSGRVRANARLARFGAWYDDIRTQYGK